MSRFAKSMILMALAACLACASPGVGSVRPGSHGDPETWRLEQAPIAAAAPALTSGRSTSRPGSSLARPSTWRYRIKTHFEPKDGLGFRPVDLGPVETPRAADVPIRCERNPIVALLLIPLRC